MNVNLSAMMQTAITILTTVWLRLLGAIAIWIVGRWLIGLALRRIGGSDKTKIRSHIDPNVLAAPAPDVEILTFNLSGSVLAVRPYCSNQHYWQVYFDTNRLVSDALTQAGFPVPEQHYSVRGSDDLSLARTA